MNIANDPEILELCQQERVRRPVHRLRDPFARGSGCHGQAINHPERYLEVVQKIHDHGIGIDGSFVFGLDGDDEGVFERTVDFVRNAPRWKSAYYSILTPYPGTRLHRAPDSRRPAAQRTDWSLYDSSHVVYRPKTFTPDNCWRAITGRSRNRFRCRSDLPAALGHHRLEALLLPYEFRVSAKRRAAYSQRAYQAAAHTRRAQPKSRRPELTMLFRQHPPHHQRRPGSSSPAPAL